MRSARLASPIQGQLGRNILRLTVLQKIDEAAERHGRFPQFRAEGPANRHILGKVLADMPVSARKQLNDLPDDLITKVNILYYTDAREALLKAIVE